MVTVAAADVILAELEMTTMALLCAGRLLLQTVGLVMGGCCNPGLAILCV